MSGLGAELGAWTYLAGLAVAGWTAARGLQGPRTGPGAGVARAALGFAWGAGGVACLLFWLSRLGWAPSRLAVAALLAAGCGSALPSLRRRLADGCAARRRPRHPHGPPRIGLDAALGALLLLPLSWLCLETRGQPLYPIDALAIWHLKAKVVLAEPVGASRYFGDLSRSFSHLDYPLLLPFASAGLYAWLGAVDEPRGKLLHLAFCLALAGLLFDALARRVGRRPALLLLLLYLGNVGLLAEWSAGLANAALLLYATAALGFLLDWQARGERRALAGLALASGLGAFTKNEGLALALLHGLALLGPARPRGSARAPRRDLAAAALYAAGVAALLLPWWLFAADIPRSHENYAARLRPEALLANAERVPQVVGAFGRDALDPRRWGGFWWLLLALAPLGLAGADRRRVRLLAALLAAELAVFAAAVVVSPWDARELLGIKTFTLLMLASPPALLLAAELWRGAYEASPRASAAPAPAGGPDPPASSRARAVSRAQR